MSEKVDCTLLGMRSPNFARTMFSWAFVQSVHDTLAGTFGIVPAERKASPIDSRFATESVPVNFSISLSCSVTQSVLLLLVLYVT